MVLVKGFPDDKKNIKYLYTHQVVCSPQSVVVHCSSNFQCLLCCIRYMQHCITYSSARYLCPNWLKPFSSTYITRTGGAGDCNFRGLWRSVNVGGIYFREDTNECTLNNFHGKHSTWFISSHLKRQKLEVFAVKNDRTVCERESCGFSQKCVSLVPSESYEAAKADGLSLIRQEETQRKCAAF